MVLYTKFSRLSNSIITSLKILCWRSTAVGTQWSSFFANYCNPEEWLEYVINKLDEMNFSIQEKYKSIPELLSGKALIWYSDEQEKMPNFVLFIKHFLKPYQQNMDQSCTPTPMIQDNVTYQQNDRKDDIINSLRN